MNVNRVNELEVKGSIDVKRWVYSWLVSQNSSSAELQNKSPLYISVSSHILFNIFFMYIHFHGEVLSGLEINYTVMFQIELYPKNVSFPDTYIDSS